MKLAIIAEHDGKQLKPATLSAITAAQAFGGHCSLILLGNELTSVIEDSQQVKGFNEIIAIEHQRLIQPVAEDMCQCLLAEVVDYDVVLAPATTFGKNLMPRLAAQMAVNAYADVIDIAAVDTFVRPIYAGNILQTVKALDSKKVLTIRPTAFQPAERTDKADRFVQLKSATFGELSTKFESSVMSQSERPELGDARVVVSGGRGLQSSEKFKLVETLADKLGAAVGASRAAVDAGFVANDFQVGQTGKVVAPELYIALGISGAIQHLAGMKDSKIIVAINKDPEAPIFQLATYGLVGDLFELVPELIEKLS